MRAAAGALCLALALGACAPRLAGPADLHLLHSAELGSDAAEEVHELILGYEGDTVRAILRRPADTERAAGALPGIVLLAGRETGREAAAVIPGPLEAVVLAVEYPEVIPVVAELREIVPHLPAIRRSAYRVPGLLRSAARFLAAMPEVDARRIGLVGVSFGVPFAAAAATDTVFCCVALHHGGAGLGELFRSNLPLDNRVLRWVASAWAGLYFARLEPARHVGRISPRPLLLINGTRDRLVPPGAALRLARAAREPVRHIWLPHDHPMPDDFPLMRELADSTLSHFPQLRERRRAGPADTTLAP